MASLFFENLITEGRDFVRLINPWEAAHGGDSEKKLTDNVVDYNNVGIKPDIECYITLRDYENNYDSIMAEGLSYIRNRCENLL